MNVNSTWIKTLSDLLETGEVVRSRNSNAIELLSRTIVIDMNRPVVSVLDAQSKTGYPEVFLSHPVIGAVAHGDDMIITRRR
ncbi:hypothetical protein NKDENANG_01050 [Candidatus Entotheonellaceae bacterium PAL068K]